MGFGKSAQVAKPAPKIEQPTPLSSRCHIRDLRRKGESVITSFFLSMFLSKNCKNSSSIISIKTIR